MRTPDPFYIRMPYKEWFVIELMRLEGNMVSLTAINCLTTIFIQAHAFNRIKK